jgi:hypothetical protein
VGSDMFIRDSVFSPEILTSGLDWINKIFSRFILLILKHLVHPV